MSGFYIGVDGKARKIKGGYVGIDGKARKVKKGYIGVDGVARLCYTDASFDPVFANNTWDDVIAACQSKAIPDTWNVGDQLTMTIDGVDYAVDIIGKNHDDYADGSGKAPLTFQLHECYTAKFPMNITNTNSNGWGSCYMRGLYLPNILELLPAAVKNNIREVNKTTNHSGAEGDVTADKLFLLSEIEVFGFISGTDVGEGSQYEYYTKSSNNRKKTVNGTTSPWWTRSPYRMNTSYFVISDGVGNPNETYASTNQGVSFAFCF